MYFRIFRATVCRLRLLRFEERVTGLRFCVQKQQAARVYRRIHLACCFHKQRHEVEGVVSFFVDAVNRARSINRSKWCGCVRSSSSKSHRQRWLWWWFVRVCFVLPFFVVLQGRNVLRAWQDKPEAARYALMLRAEDLPLGKPTELPMSVSEYSSESELSNKQRPPKGNMCTLSRLHLILLLLLELDRYLLAKGEGAGWLCGRNCRRALCSLPAVVVAARVYAHSFIFRGCCRGHLVISDGYLKNVCI